MRHLLVAIAVCVLAYVGGASKPTKSPAQPSEDDTTTMPHLVKRGVLDTIVNSDESWGLLVLELAEKWGEARDKVVAQFQKIHDSGVIKIGWTNVHDSIVGSTGEEVSIAQEYNITGVPTLLFWCVKRCFLPQLPYYAFELPPVHPVCSGHPVRSA